MGLQASPVSRVTAGNHKRHTDLPINTSVLWITPLPGVEVYCKAKKRLQERTDEMHDSEFSTAYYLDYVDGEIVVKSLKVPAPPVIELGTEEPQGWLGEDGLWHELW